jgi:hypothetical protein
MKMGLKVSFLVLGFFLLTSVDVFAAPRAGTELGRFSVGCYREPNDEGDFVCKAGNKSCGSECTNANDATTCKNKGTCSSHCSCLLTSVSQSSMDESASGAKQADLANSLSQLRQKLEDPSSALQDKQALEKMLIDALHDLSKM